MNRVLSFGVATFLAIVGLSLLGGEKQAQAGHGCHGACDGAFACAGKQKCAGFFAGRCAGVQRCHGHKRCAGFACAGRGHRCEGRFGGKHCHGRRAFRCAGRCAGACAGCVGCAGGVPVEGPIDEYDDVPAEPEGQPASFQYKELTFRN